LAGISRGWKIEIGEDGFVPMDSGELQSSRDPSLRFGMTNLDTTRGTDLKVGHYKKINLAGARMWLA
jgi:hypothetical protein